MFDRVFNTHLLSVDVAVYMGGTSTLKTSWESIVIIIITISILNFFIVGIHDESGIW